LRGWRPISAALPTTPFRLSVFRGGRLPFHHQAQWALDNRASIGKRRSHVNPFHSGNSSEKMQKNLADKSPEIALKVSDACKYPVADPCRARRN
jgi:hypothetical protein